MDVQKVLHMNGGEGNTSYANNSTPERAVLYTMKPMIKEAVEQVCGSCRWPSGVVPKSIRIGDLGCASGPNAFAAISMIIDAIHQLRCMHMQKMITELELGSGGPDQLELFLNDLPGNDFNANFKNLPHFYDRLVLCDHHEFGGPFLVFGAPGSFYGRLFASGSMHMVFSSLALHWLSQTPQGLENMNKGNICLSKTSPLPVYEAYVGQFQRDFTSFLKFRSSELAPGGRMLITLVSRRTKDPFAEECCDAWNYLAQALNNMVSMGLVNEEKMDSFNLPFYAPSAEEMKDVIEVEGSFHIKQLKEKQFISSSSINDYDYEIDELGTDCYNNTTTAKALANHIRAIAESIVSAHFGEAASDKVFELLEEHVSGNLAEGPYAINYLAISLMRNDE